MYSLIFVLLGKVLVTVIYVWTNGLKLNETT